MLASVMHHNLAQHVGCIKQGSAHAFHHHVAGGGGASLLLSIPQHIHIWACRIKKL